MKPFFFTFPLFPLPNPFEQIIHMRFFLTCLLQISAVQCAVHMQDMQFLPALQNSTECVLAVDLYNNGSSSSDVAVQDVSCCVSATSTSGCSNTIAALPPTLYQLMQGVSPYRFAFRVVKQRLLETEGRLLCRASHISEGNTIQEQKTFSVESIRSVVNVPQGGVPMPAAVRPQMIIPEWTHTPFVPGSSADCAVEYGALRPLFLNGECVVDVTLLESPPPMPTGVPATEAAGSSAPSVERDFALFDLSDFDVPAFMSAPDCVFPNATWDAGRQRCTGCPTEACSLPYCRCNAKEFTTTMTLGVDCGHGAFDYGSQSCVCTEGWKHTADAQAKRIFCNVLDSTPLQETITRGAPPELSTNLIVSLRQIVRANPGLCSLLVFFLIVLFVIGVVCLNETMRLLLSRAIHNAMLLSGALDRDVWKMLDEEITAALEALSVGGNETRKNTLLDTEELPPWVAAALATEPEAWKLAEYRGQHCDTVFTVDHLARSQTSQSEGSLEDVGAGGGGGGGAGGDEAVPNPLSRSLFTTQPLTLTTQSPPQGPHPSLSDVKASATEPVHPSQILVSTDSL